MNVVYGSECLQYIDRKIGFVSHSIDYGSNTPLSNIVQLEGSTPSVFTSSGSSSYVGTSKFTYNTTCQRWSHDPTKRKIGLVLGKGADGGLEVALLGDEPIHNSRGDDNGGIEYSTTKFYFGVGSSYTYHQFTDQTVTRDHLITTYPTCERNPSSGSNGVPAYCLLRNTGNVGLGYETTLDYNPAENFTANGGDLAFGIIWKYAGALTDQRSYRLTDDKNNTMVFGVRDYTFDTYPIIYKDDPLKCYAGDFYQLACDLAEVATKAIPAKFQTVELIQLYTSEFWTEDIDRTKGVNMTAIPFNLILTNDPNQAKQYLRDGTLPSDAFLYPLDFANIPKYQSDENDDSEEDDDTDDIDDGDERDTDENLPEVPPYTGGSMNNNNVYLLLPGELNEIIDWFWNDVGDVQDLDDLMTKIEGLANNLAQNFLMFRIMPVNPLWIGGYGTDGNFIVGGVEKSGTFKTLGKHPATIEDIGHWHFSDKYTSYKFLNYEPYSDFKLYLPYHGIVDLDVGVYQGHTLYVKAVYDYLSGTITYMLYCDNIWLTNTFTAKMCVDLNISLQSKNERDNTIYGNVTNAVAGIMGAGSTLATGNPIGLAIGANAIVTQGQSAPYKVMASVGEDGAFYAPQKCAILIRRPKVSRPKTYKENIGRQAFESRKLKTLKGKGYTTIINPCLEFTELKPLPEEAEELNQLLSDGVFL